VLLVAVELVAVVFVALGTVPVEFVEIVVTGIGVVLLVFAVTF